MIDPSQAVESYKFGDILKQWGRERLVHEILVARAGDKPAIIRAETLEHLLKVMREGIDPDPRMLSEEFVARTDFRDWLIHTGRTLPAFWFGSEERLADTL